MRKISMSTESSLIKHFNKACVDYHLLEDDDKILVAVSGGKDSLILLRLLSQRAKIYKPRITIEAVHVIMDNIPYETDRTYLEDYCKELDVHLHILHSSFDETTDKRKTKCFLCSWNRRKTLFDFAQNNHFNKVALGHHNDDILTTFLMNMTYEGSLETMKPSLQLEHYPLTIIRPLCLIKESELKLFSAELKLQKQKSLCPYEEITKRTKMNEIFHKLEDINPEARYNLWHAIMNK